MVGGWAGAVVEAGGVTCVGAVSVGGGAAGVTWVGAAGVTAGGALGGLLGLLAGLGALAIPGAGPFIAAGPILAALSGGAVGAAVGGVTGALVGLGIPEMEARLYEGKLKEGNILVAAHSDDRAMLKEAQDLFQACGATHIKTGSTTKVPKDPSVDRDDDRQVTQH